MNATIYSDSNYRGSSKELGLGSYNVKDLGIGNDKLSSLRVPDGLRVTMYHDGDFKGSQMTCVRDTPYVGDSVNDEISSILVEKVTTTFPVLYTDTNYQGWSHYFGEGRFDLGKSIGNDKLSSVIVPEGYKVTLYEDAGFSGRTLVLTADASSLGDFNDRATSFVVEKMKAMSPPTLDELKSIIQATAPHRYLHPDDEFGPSSVEWFLQRATLKNKDGSSRKASSAPLPSTGGDDGSDWLELPTGARGGDLSTAVAYVNAKCTSKYWIDLQYWFFYPYNGAGKGTVTAFNQSTNLDLDPMGEHGGDWEQCTFRIELGTRKILAVYMAQHSGGVWLSPSDLQYENGIPIVYSSRHGHATYPSEGQNLTNATTLKDSFTHVTWFQFGLRNDTAKSSKVLDCRAKFQIIGADFLGSAITAPDWLSYPRRWGPHIVYDLASIKKSLVDQLCSWSSLMKAGADEAADAIIKALPDECKEENGPTGPKFKGCWSGDE